MSFKDKPLKKSHTDQRLMIDEIHENVIKNIDKSEDIYSYYLDNGLLLNQYYKINSDNKKNTNTEDNNILSFFYKSNETSRESEEEINRRRH